MDPVGQVRMHWPHPMQVSGFIEAVSLTVMASAAHVSVQSPQPVHDFVAHPRRDARVLGELSLPSGAPHTEVLEGAAESRQLVSLEVGDQDQAVGLDDVGPDVGVIEISRP